MRLIRERVRDLARGLVSLTVAKRAPSYRGLVPASMVASRAAHGASKKSGTNCEILLRRALRAQGLVFTVNVASLPGCPDIVFSRARLIVFCDGDFWHGRRLDARVRRLSRGHNAAYWISKIRANVRRDTKNRRTLRELGWQLLRLWESEIKADPERAAERIRRFLGKRKAKERKGR